MSELSVELLIDIACYWCDYFDFNPDDGEPYGSKYNAQELVKFLANFKQRFETGTLDSFDKNLIEFAKAQMVHSQKVEGE